MKIDFQIVLGIFRGYVYLSHLRVNSEQELSLEMLPDQTSNGSKIKGFKQLLKRKFFRQKWFEQRYQRQEPHKPARKFC